MNGSLTDEQVHNLLSLAADLRAYLEAHGPRKHAVSSPDDPWLDLLPRSGPPVASSNLMRSRLSLSRPSARDAHRLAACMRRLGWSGPRMVNVNGRFVRGYQMEV